MHFIRGFLHVLIVSFFVQIFSLPFALGDSKELSAETKAFITFVSDRSKPYVDRKGVLVRALKNPVVDKDAVFEAAFKISDPEDRAIVQEAVHLWIVSQKNRAIPATEGSRMAKAAFVQHPKVKRMAEKIGPDQDLIVSVAKDASAGEETRAEALRLLMRAQVIDQLDELKEISRTESNPSVLGESLRLWALKERNSPELHDRILKALQSEDSKTQRGALFAAVALGESLPASIRDQFPRVIEKTQDLLVGEDNPLSESRIALVKLVPRNVLEKAFSQEKYLQEFKGATCSRVYFDGFQNVQAKAPIIKVDESQLDMLDFLLSGVASNPVSTLANRIHLEALLPHLKSEDRKVQAVAKSLARRLLETGKNRNSQSAITEEIRKLLTTDSRPGLGFVAHRALERFSGIPTNFKRSDPEEFVAALSKFAPVDAPILNEHGKVLPWAQLTLLMKKKPLLALENAYVSAARALEQKQAIKGLEHLMKNSEQSDTQLAAAWVIAEKHPGASLAVGAVNQILANSVDSESVNLLFRLVDAGQNLELIRWDLVAGKLRTQQAGRYDLLDTLANRRNSALRESARKFLLPLLKKETTDTWVSEQNSLGRIAGSGEKTAEEGAPKAATRKSSKVSPEQRLAEALVQLAKPDRQAQEKALKTLKVLKLKMSEKGSPQTALLAYVHARNDAPDLQVRALEAILQWRGKVPNPIEQAALVLMHSCATRAKFLKK